jgi:hypothetical protein
LPALVLLLAAGFFHGPPARDQLRFGPEPGAEVTRRWSETLALEIDSLDETLGGNPIRLSFDRIELETRRAFEVADVLTRSADGRPLDLTRRYEASELGLQVEMDDRPLARASGSHDCDESAVRFVYEPDEERYTRERIEGDIDDERLEALEPDLELLSLLPAGEVELGATFELEPEALRTFFAAGGGLGFHTTERVAEDTGVPDEVIVAGVLGSFHELFGPAGELSGKVKGKFVSRDEDESGSVLARLEYQLRVKAEAELGERLRSLLEKDGATRDLRAEGELEGRLVVLWDETKKHLRSARYEGDASLAGHLVFPLELVDDQEPLEFTGDYELSGEAVVELVCE